MAHRAGGVLLPAVQYPALDFIFYDVRTLRAALAEKDAPMQARARLGEVRVGS
jgi:hypothetical protein